MARLEVTRGETKALEMPLYASEDVKVGTLQQRAFDGLLEVSTGWVRRALTGVFNGI